MCVCIYMCLCMCARSPATWLEAKPLSFHLLHVGSSTKDLKVRHAAQSGEERWTAAATATEGKREIYWNVFSGFFYI